MLAETADRILEYYQSPVVVNAVSRITTAPTIDNVLKRPDDLTLEASQLRDSRVSRIRIPSISHRQRPPLQCQVRPQCTVSAGTSIVLMG
ncbi:hypothetical protein SprV_0401386600 [Sparganum proliferum]